MGESCAGTCIMEGRFQKIEDGMSKQSDMYRQDQVESAKQTTGLQKDVERIFDIVSEMNAKLDEALSRQRKDEIRNAANENKIAASKWQSLSASAKAIIVTITAATIMLGIGYLFSLAK